MEHDARGVWHSLSTATQNGMQFNGEDNFVSGSEGESGGIITWEGVGRSMGLHTSKSETGIASSPVTRGQNHILLLGAYPMEMKDYFF